MARLSQLLLFIACAAVPTALAQSDDPIFVELCNSGIEGSDGSPVYCRNCWEYITDADDIDGCAVLWSQTTRNCGDIYDNLDDQNAGLLEMSGRDTTKPLEWIYRVNKFLARFTLGTTAIHSSDQAFRAWRNTIADVVVDEGWQDSNELPAYWKFKVRPIDPDQRVTDSIATDFSCTSSSTLGKEVAGKVGQAFGVPVAASS